MRGDGVGTAWRALRAWMLLTCALEALGRPQRTVEHSAEHLLRAVEHLRDGLGLDEKAPVGAMRFIPRTKAQYLASVLTLWNLLDRNIEAHLGSGGPPFGYMRPVQLEAYSQLVLGTANKTYCEVGFNGGHGTVAMLLASSSLVAHSFELEWDGPFSRTASELLSLYFGKRFHYHVGDAKVTVPRFAQTGTQVGTRHEPARAAPIGMRVPCTPARHGVNRRDRIRAQPRSAIFSSSTARTTPSRSTPTSSRCASSPRATPRS